MSRNLLRFLGVALLGAALIVTAYFTIPKTASPEKKTTETSTRPSTAEKTESRENSSETTEKEKITLPTKKTAENKDRSSAETETSESGTSGTQTEPGPETNRTGSSSENGGTDPSENNTESTENTTETSPGPHVPDWSRVAFIGDSRTVFMGSGGERPDKGAGLVPDDALFATYGGTLTAASAFEDAWSAGVSGRPLAVFWFGVNDVQLDPERDNAEVFIVHYQDIISLFREENPEAEIVILSVVDTSVHEKDHYEGQEENIRRYNAALQRYASEEGFRFLDLSFMNTSEADFLPDAIHFTKDWYERFVPALQSLLGL